jgi:hypothetical protein
MHTADDLRALLMRCALTQRGAARRLEIDERKMRRYCSGALAVPETVWLALLQVSQRTEGNQ